MDEKPHAITEWMTAWRAGDDGARDRVVGALYQELRRLAAQQLRRERAGHTLQATALVNEALLRLIGSAPPAADRRHLLGIAGHAMREVLVDHARRREAAKRGGDVDKIPLEEAGEIALPADVDLLALDSALRRLEALDPDQVRVVELRYFVGLTIEETAQAMDLHPSAVNREWTAARAWLLAELAP